MVPPRQRRTVLWVKGDWRHRRALQRHLEKLDFSVIEVAHGRGAIQQLDEDRPDLACLEAFTAAAFLSTVSPLLKTAIESEVGAK